MTEDKPMKAECPMGHTENLSHKELLERLKNEDFSCRQDGCIKNYSYEVDEVFWERYVQPNVRELFYGSPNQ